MANPFFKFKQFTVYHDLCAMKVGTDGVLLGAWANCTGTNHILDIGTGSGLIALMLAQRCPNTTIDALDIDSDAFSQAKNNFINSQFKDRLNIFLCDFLAYQSTCYYDLIISNPPYFNDSLLSPDKARTRARHSSELKIQSLLSKAETLLSETGRIALILPVLNFDSTQAIAADNNLFLARKTLVIPLEGRPPKRVLLEYSKKKLECEEKELVIEISRHLYSPDYKTLTKDFYL
ncbi:methyltransferase [Bacteroidales bacterium OttesenSCG-928-M06]|nr:methyltransferase [Bacteroidales bacterium OttesenSCG-928-M06]